MLIAIVKKRLALDASLSTILQLISVTAFEKIPIDQLLSKSTLPNQSHDPGNQLILFSD